MSEGQEAGGGRLSGVVLIALALTYLYLARDYPLGPVRSVPGPGMLPLILGFTLLILSFVYVIRSFIRAPAEKPERKPLSPLVLCLLLFYGYVISFPGLGYLLSTFLFGLLALSLLFKLAWRSSVLYSLFLAALFHAVFYHFLGVPLPWGVVSKLISG